MKLLPLSRGLFTKVDDGDFDVLSKFKWSATGRPAGRAGTTYAHRRFNHGTESRGIEKLHRTIMGLAPGATNGIHVDHINGDGLDNQRANLRICKPGENSRNLHRSWSKYGVRGITKSGDKWRARIRIEGKLICVGFYETQRDAAVAYAFASKVFHGEFGNLVGHDLVMERAK